MKPLGVIIAKEWLIKHLLPHCAGIQEEPAAKTEFAVMCQIHKDKSHVIPTYQAVGGQVKLAFPQKLIAAYIMWLGQVNLSNPESALP